MNIFENRVAIVTGSSKGIGRQLALELAKRGALVVLNGPIEEELHTTRRWFSEQGYSNVLAITADITDEVNGKKLIEDTLTHFGRIDLLFNNAGLGMTKAAIEHTTPESFRKMMAVNVLGHINITHFALPHLRQTNGGVLFTGSIAGLHGLPGYASYSTSKMALTAIAESLRNELKGSGVYVGIAYVGMTQNDPDKQILEANGKLVTTTKGGAHHKFEPQDVVARRMLRMVEKKQHKRYFTPLGKLNMILNRLSPGFVSWVLGRFA
jgi:NAD(P)-dependent dehydrogenase (short-subunit alcohol dehydrogenase family)